MAIIVFPGVALYNTLGILRVARLYLCCATPLDDASKGRESRLVPERVPSGLYEPFTPKTSLEFVKGGLL